MTQVVKPLHTLQKLKKPFTLVELLVVISILAILISLLYPSLSNMIYRANFTKCKTQMKNIHNGVMLYSDDFNGIYPRYGNARSFPNDFGYNSAYINAPETVDDRRQSKGAIIIPLRPYYDNMKETFMCSELAKMNYWKTDLKNVNTNYDKNDKNGQKPLPAGYSLYFNAFTKYGSTTTDHWAHPNNIMYREGDVFRFKPNSSYATNLNQILEFDIIASDYAFGKGAYGVHVPPSINKTEHKRNGHHPNFSYHSAQWIDYNYIFTDGAVREWASIKGRRTKNKDLVTNYNDSGHAYFPLDYALNYQP